MLKIFTLLHTIFLTFSMLSISYAVDFKTKGQMVLSFDAGDNGNFNENSYGYDGKQDNINIRQRTRLQLNAVASETLSGTLYFEINSQWGKAGDTNWGGGSLGTDGKNVLLKNAYIDWVVPNTALTLRMGLQLISLPSIIGSQIQDDDAAGITASYSFNNNVSFTWLWARLYNDNYIVTQDNTGYLDNIDLFAATLPLNFDSFQVTPWVAYGMVGKNAAGNSTYAGRKYFSTVNRHGMKNYEYSNLYMAGLTSVLNLCDPFQLSAEFFYTGLDTGYNSDNVHGWFGTLLAEYRLDWSTPGLYVWHASGEDGNSSNGSERFVTLGESTQQQYSAYGMNGNPSNIARDSTLGASLAGTWGIGARLKDMRFVEGLKHSLRVNYYIGTNNEKAIKANQDNGFALLGSLGNNLTMQESALEFGLGTHFQVYDNMKITSDIAYISLHNDENIKRGYTIGNAWNVNVSLIYSF